MPYMAYTLTIAIRGPLKAYTENSVLVSGMHGASAYAWGLSLCILKAIKLHGWA